MGTVSITGIKPGSTSLKLTAGTVTKIIPIAVTAAPGLSALTITATAKQGGGYTVEDSKAPASDETRRYMVTSASEKPTVAYDTVCDRASGWVDWPADNTIQGGKGQIVTVVHVTASGAKARALGEATLPAPLPAPRPEAIQVTPESLTLGVGEKGTLDVKVLPEDADQSVIVAVSDRTIVAAQAANGKLTVNALKAGTTNLGVHAGKVMALVPVTVTAKPTVQGPLALFGDSQLIIDSDTGVGNMGRYPSGANPGTATSWPSDQSKQIASITGLRVIDLYYGGARLARDESGYLGGWAMQSNRLDALVKSDAANTPEVIVIYGFYINDLQNDLTATEPATDLSKIAATYKSKFDELKAKYPQARIFYALQCSFRSAATEAKPRMTGLPAGTIMTNSFTALQSSERILFTEATLGVPVIDATDEVWALGSGLTISDMIHPTAEGAVKLGQILGRHIKQALQEG